MNRTRPFLLLTFISCSVYIAHAQSVGINTDKSTPNAHAMLDIKSSTKGILIPRLDSNSRKAIPATKGLLVYDTTTSTFWYNDGAAWQQIAAGRTAVSGTKNYVAKYTGTTSVGNSQIVDNGQYVGIGTSNPTAGLTIIHNGGIVAKGDTLSANHYVLAETGPGAKFIWEPKKGALRAGYLDNVYGFLWNDEYIGKWSVGLGYNIYAPGTASFAAGYQTSARGAYSFSTGNNCDASRIGSTAIGNAAKAEGDYSFAEGNGTTAVGISSVAMGNATATQGNYSFALGNNTYSGGNNSFAMGSSAQATGNTSVSLGISTVSAGDYSFAEGATTKANGFCSVAMGNGSIAKGVCAFSGGAICNANGDYSVAIGRQTTANGTYSAAFGLITNAGGDYSFAAGNGTEANGKYSFADGNGARADGQSSVAIGSNIIASGHNSMIFGQNLFDAGHKGDLMMGDTDPWNAGSVGSGTDDQMICRFNNGYYFITGGNTYRTGISASHGDNSWSQISDSNRKEKILPVNGEAILNKIAQFKLSTWNYKGQDPSVFRHYGPMAQDFHNAFGHDGYGTIGNDTLINQADFLGVSFTAIQALEKRTEKIERQQKQLDDLQTQNNILLADNEKLQSQMQTLIAMVNNLNKETETASSNRSKTNTVSKPDNVK